MQNDGRLFGEQEVVLDIRGLGEKSVNLDVKVEAGRQGVPDGGWVNGWTGCGVGYPKRHLFARLTPGGVEQEILVDEQPNDDAVSVSQSKPETYVLHVSAVDGIYDWSIRIDYTSEEADGVMEITSIQGRDLVLVSGGDPVVFSVGIPPAPEQLTRDDRGTEIAADTGSVC